MAKSRLDSALRISGALVAVWPPVILFAAALAAYLPVERGAAFAIALVAAIPLLVTAMCVAFLARRGWHVWAIAIVATLVLSLLTPHAAFVPTLP